MDELSASRKAALEKLIKVANVMEVTDARRYLQRLNEDRSIDRVEKVNLIDSIMKTVGENCFQRRKRYIKRRNRPSARYGPVSESTSSDDQQYPTRPNHRRHSKRNTASAAPVRRLTVEKSPVRPVKVHRHHESPKQNLAQANYLLATPMNLRRLHLRSVNQLETVSVATYFQECQSSTSSRTPVGVLLEPIKVLPPVKVMPRRFSYTPPPKDVRPHHSVPTHEHRLPSPPRELRVPSVQLIPRRFAYTPSRDVRRHHSASAREYCIPTREHRVPTHERRVPSPHEYHIPVRVTTHAHHRLHERTHAARRNGNSCECEEKKKELKVYPPHS